MSIEGLFLVGAADAAEKFPPVPRGAKVIGKVPEWLRPWFPSDSFAQAAFGPVSERVRELQSSSRRIGPDSPEADEVSKHVSVTTELVEARKAVFSVGLKKHLLDNGQFEECAVLVCEDWQIARLPMNQDCPLELLVLSAMLGRLARA